MAQYGNLSYWDARYTKDTEPFDWYQRYSGVRDLVNQFVKREDKILNLGCGNSRMSEEMFEDGYTSITNIDFSRTVIEHMVEKHKSKPSLQWQQMNATGLDFPDETFDVVVAKATVDAILCGEGSSANIAKVCSEVSRVLKPKGVFFIVSFGVPDNRLNYLTKDDSYGWTVATHTVAKPTISASAFPSVEDPNGVHYIYVCSKGDCVEES